MVQNLGLVTPLGGAREATRALRRYGAPAIEELDELVLVARQPLDEVAPEEPRGARLRRILREAHGLIPECVILHLLPGAGGEPVEREPRTREVVALVRDVDPANDGVHRELSRGERDADDDKGDDREARQDRARRRRAWLDGWRCGQRRENRHWLGSTGRRRPELCSYSRSARRRPQWRRQTIRRTAVSHAVKGMHRERQEDPMKDRSKPWTTQTTGGSLRVFDERGRLIGTIDRPLQRDALGTGRATVYLARRVHESKRSAA